MKTLITTIALASSLAAGTVSATNFEVGQLGGVDVQTTPHSISAAVMETSNLPGSSYSSALFVGNK
ncbi:hypothetical protein Q4488_09815 [Amphritea sp. 1_MG-2023]|uniref:hypothetical protein n=1 Tax=Amphritea sp. 1_MG-2023 TaxID=3062670 RepID=UPI0026E377BD|nr:hypothetical protein [Amphritea sp. 1_MG-2023]MDO6563680.1 hypothetical protein [Amphritea sp. 1_MG-2023]